MGWMRVVYMPKMDVADATPLNVAMPTPPTSPIHMPTTAATEVEPSVPAEAPTALVEAYQSPAASPPVVPASSHTTTTSPATTPTAMPPSRESTPDSPLGSTPGAPPSPPPAQSEEAAPIHILQLRNQLQWIEARQLQMQAETKVFQQNLITFLCFLFPATATYFNAQPEAIATANRSTATQPLPSANPSTKAGTTEEVHFLLDDENDVFDWQSPRDHLQHFGPTPPKPAEAVPILSVGPTPATSAIAERPTPDSPARRKGKATAGRSITRQVPSIPEEEEQEQRPAKRQRRYHVIIADSDHDSSAGIPVALPEKSVDPSLSSTF
ncbi:hypothetical protein V6N11_018391 [Hibiscus sabdariffa]|uniref:Uncharacterized protein n=1 Tax=Hibiscus sabdariffa TaxID=183260 RepID=A0ABR2T787_9ROSI